MGGLVGGLVLGPVVSLFTDISSWLIGQLYGLVTAATTPSFDGAWWAGIYSRMVVASTAVALALLLVAAALGALRGDGRSLGRAVSHLLVWGVLTAAAAPLVTLAAGAIDVLCAGFIAAGGQDAGAVLSTATNVTGMSPGVTLLAALAMIGGALLLFVEMIARDAVLVLVTAFAPIALAGLVWSGSAGWARTLGRYLAVALFSKLIIVAGMSVGLALISNFHFAGGGVGLSIAAGMILLVIGIMPFQLLKHAPGGAPPIGRAELSKATGMDKAQQVGTQAAMSKIGRRSA